MNPLTFENLLRIACNILLALILVNSLDIKDLSSTKQYCGHIDFKTKSGTVRVNISEGEIIPQIEFDKIRVNDGGYIHFEDEKKVCQVSLCGFGRVGLFEYAGNCFEMTLSQNFPLRDQNAITNNLNDSVSIWDFTTTSISCACPKNHENHICDVSRCSIRPLELDDCAILCREHECHDCIYEEMHLRHGERFETKNSAVVRSLIVNPDCAVTMTTFGKYYEEKITEFYFNRSQKELAGSPSYFAHGEEFECICPHLEVKGSDATLINPVMIIAGTILIVSLLTPTIVLIMRKYRTRKPRIYLTKEEWAELAELIDIVTHQCPNVDEDSTGGRNQSLNIENKEGFVDEGSTHDHIEQIQTPPLFDKRFKINRRKLNFDRCSEPLGKGNFGIVFRGKLCQNQVGDEGTGSDLDVAVKTIDMHNANIMDLRSLVNEIRISAYIGEHPNVVSLIGAHFYLSPKNLEVLSIMELCSQSLKKFLTSERELCEPSKPMKIDLNKGPGGYTAMVSFNNTQSDMTSGDIGQSGISPTSLGQNIQPGLLKDLVRWAGEIANGMEYLNEKKILHIDLATRNILLSSDNTTAKISDFGLSRNLYEKVYYEKSRNGGQIDLPLKWMALEALLDYKFSVKSDIWSYGVTLWEIFSLGVEPYPSIQSGMELLSYLCSGRRLERPQFASDEIYTKLMRRCWDTNSESRPSFCEIKHFFSTEIN